jgi:arsenite/tail-anchored protein-transporting ATPase
VPITVPGGRARGSLEGLQIDAPSERQRFLARWRETIVTIIDRGTYLDLEDITGFVDAALPGADEIFAMLRLGELEQTNKYHCIVVDTAPTGHTLRLLDLPRTFAATIQLLEAMQSKHRFMVRSLTRTYRADAADAFLDELRQRTGALTQALRNPGRAAALLVTRPEPLVVAESERYAAELAASGIHVAAVIVNGVGQAPSGRVPQTALDALATVAPDVPRYVVPQLAETPVGVVGLERWSDALIEGRRTLAAKREPASRKTRGTKAVAARRSGNAPSSARRHPHAPARTLLAGSLTIVGGKGGVGKTTTACALAIQAAELAPPTLIVSTDPAPSIADALAQPVGDEETPVPGVPGLFARQMDATAAFREFRRSYQQRIDALFDAFVRRGVDAARDRAILRDLLALSPPGIDELYALASLGETLSDRHFARIVIDPAPTGHLLRLLQMPALALDWTHRLMRLMLKYREVAGLGESAAELLSFSRRTRRLGELLRDPEQAGLVVVSLDEPLVRGETSRLVAAARAEGLDVRGVVWNRWTGGAPPSPLSANPPVAQFVAPAATPAPIGALLLRAWADHWREVSELDV